MTSYDIIKMAFYVSTVIIGVGMLVKPEKFLKKGSEGTEAEISKIRRAGTFITVIGILVVLFNIVFILKY